MCACVCMVCLGMLNRPCYERQEARIWVDKRPLMSAFMLIKCALCRHTSPLIDIYDLAPLFTTAAGEISHR